MHVDEVDDDDVHTKILILFYFTKIKNKTKISKK